MANQSSIAAVHDSWVFRGLLVLMVWAPLPLGSNRTWAIGVLLLFALSLLLGTLFAWRRLEVGAFERMAKFRWPLGILAAIVVLSWFQTFSLPAAWVQSLSPVAASAQLPAQWMTLSLDVHQSRIMASLAFVYWSVFFVAIMAVRSAERLERLALVLVWSGVLQAVLGALLFSVRAEYRLFYVSVSHLRMIGSFVYHNSLAAYMCLCLSVGIGLMLARLSGTPKRLGNWRARITAAIAFALSPTMRLRLLLVIMVIALVLTRSRMGNTAFFAALLTVGLLAIVLARKRAPQTIALVTSLIIIDIFVVGMGVGLEKVVQRIQDTEMMVADGGAAESVEARTEAARSALPIVADFPLLGSGGGSFYNVFMTYRTAQYGYAYVDHTHNDFVEIATDFGLVGLGLFGLLVVLSLWTAVRVMAKRRSRVPWGIAFGVTMAVVGLLIHSTVDFNLQIPSNALTIVVILAMGWIADALPSMNSYRKSMAGKYESS